MPEYEILYLDQCDERIYAFCATCVDDKRAKVLAHAMKLPDTSAWKSGAAHRSSISARRRSIIRLQTIAMRPCHAS